ncbi:hypothetical protein [Rhodopirellula sp. MGV]|uniref:hypothetical protein n=1 Tax=Rhodopirellula sp. MGV TaxID=2023130 RepID=UPI000B970211|nr:hypothetical protein [Rhodopirellula sp. MGV]OYP36365.1 hypothetical protein CGZ80_08615 [Rhodopirellula sp. MGV]PNY38403.1 hypothetical protein C2E31_00165 [Rhodopirellula baltica]
MKVIPLNCNHCGAPLEVDAKARFVTCSFCNARLTIRHTGSSYSTEVLDDIRETTQRIARDVEQIKSSNAIERLDQQWQNERANHLVQDKHGATHLPSKAGAIFGGGFVVLFGIFWTVMATGISSGASRAGAPGIFMIFPLFGVLFVIFGIFNAIRTFSKAESYQRDHTNYIRERRKLAEEISSTSYSD